MILRLFNKIFSHQPTWQQWADVLKPFEEILKRNDCDIVEVAKSKHFFSKIDDLSAIRSSNVKMIILNYPGDSVDIVIKVRCFKPSLTELICNLGPINCFIYSVEFYFKLSDTEFLTCMISNPILNETNFKFDSFNNKFEVTKFSSVFS